MPLRMMLFFPRNQNYQDFWSTLVCMHLPLSNQYPMYLSIFISINLIPIGIVSFRSNTKVFVVLLLVFKCF